MAAQLALSGAYIETMAQARPTAVDLTAVLSSLTGRPVRIGEIVAALNVGRSTYYEQRDEGRLVSADNLLRLAVKMDLNPVELLLTCGLINPQSVADCNAKVNTPDTTGPKPRTRRFQRRPDAPPL